MSGPGDRAPKLTDLGKSTPSGSVEDHDATPIRVDVANRVSPGVDGVRHVQKVTAREPGDLGVARSTPLVGDEQLREDDKSQSVVKNAEKSDAVVVPKKLAKTWVTPVESVEERAAAKGKSAARNALPTQCGAGAPTWLQRIGQQARQTQRFALR